MPNSNTEPSISNREDKQFELEKQFHEQYATNANANTSTFITFVVALFILFGFFGYVYVFSSPRFKCPCCFSETKLPIEAFYAISVVVGAVLCFLSKISVHLGYAQRRDELKVDNIRRKYYNENDNCPFYEVNKDETKNKSFNASNKSLISYLPNYFSLFFCLFIFAQIFVIAIVIAKLYQSDHFWKIICVQIIFIVLSIVYWIIKYYKYKKNDKENKNYNEGLSQTNSSC